MAWHHAAPRWPRRSSSRHVYPLGSRARPSAGAPRARRLRRASSSRASSARPPTSSSRTTSARARAPSSAAFAARTRRLRGPLRLQGLPVHRGPARPARGGPGVRRRLRRRAGTSRCKAGFDPGEDPPARQREVRGRAAPRRWTRASATSSSTTTRTSTASSASCPTARASASSCASRPGVSPDTHPSISTGGPNTKFGFNLQPAPRRDRAPRRLRPARPRGPAHAHRLADPRPRAVPHRAGGDRRPGDFRHGQPRRRPRRRLHQLRAPARRSRSTSRAKVDAVREIIGPRRADPRRARPRARGQLDRHAVHGAVGQAQRRSPTSPSTAACPTTCARCSTARATRRRSRRASAAGRCCHLVGKHCESGDLIVRDAELADPRVGRRRRHAGHRRLRLRDGQHLQRRPARAGRRSSRTATRALVVRRETYEDLLAQGRLTDARAASGIGLLGHGTVGSAFADAAARRARARSRPSPACGPSCAAC